MITTTQGFSSLVRARVCSARPNPSGKIRRQYVGVILDAQGVEIWHCEHGAAFGYPLGHLTPSGAKVHAQWQLERGGK